MTIQPTLSPDAALDHLLQAVLTPAPAKGNRLFLPDRILCSIGAKVALHSRLIAKWSGP